MYSSCWGGGGGGTTGTLTLASLLFFSIQTFINVIRALTSEHREHGSALFNCLCYERIIFWLQLN